MKFWQIEARRQSSNGAITWIIRFTTSNLLVGVSSNESSSHNRNAHTWDVSTRNFDRKGKTQPTAECHVLQLKHLGRVFYLGFPTTPLWNSIGHWNCQTSPETSQQHQNSSGAKDKQLSRQDRKDCQNFVHKTCSLTTGRALTRNYVDVSLQHSQGSPFGQAQFRLPPCSMQAISPRALMPTKVLRWLLQTSKVPPLVIPILVRDLRDLLSQFTSSGTCTICNKD